MRQKPRKKEVRMDFSIPKLGFGLMRLPTIPGGTDKDIDIELVKKMVDLFIERGYTYFDTATGKWQRVNRKNEGLFAEEALCFYKPFPLKKLTVASLVRYVADILSVTDFVLVAPSAHFWQAAQVLSKISQVIAYLQILIIKVPFHT